MNKVVRHSNGRPTVQGNMFAEIHSTNFDGKIRLSFSHPFVFRLLMLLAVLGLAQQGWSQVNLSNGSSSATIDFSNTTPASVGTNPTSAFASAGFSADPTTAGRLNSNAWAVAGWSDGALAFGGTQTTANTDYTRGATAVAVTTGGFYAFTGSPQSVSNPCLMIQPGGSDFAPGTLTLRIKNTGTSPITQLAVSYNLYVRNDQPRNNSFNFSHSTDNSTYTAVAALDYTSPAAADAAGWVLVGSSPSRSTTITGLLIAPNAFFYIRWSGNDVGGSGSRDEFGLDDISLSATFCPTITFTGTPVNACPASSNGQIAVSGVTGGTGPYMYSKDNGANYQSGATFTGLAANTYQVVVKDANGCTSGATPVVVGTATPPACSVSGENYVCNNTTGNVYTAPAGMSAYSWGISGAGSIPGSTTGQSVSVTSGNYLNTYTVSVTITDGNGCTSSCSKISEIFLFTPPANITVNPNPACFGATLDLSIAAQSSSTVSWTGEGVTNSSGTFVPVAFNGYSFFNNQTTAVPTTTGPHIYGVTVTTDQGCSNTGTATVTVHPAPPACSITGPASACTNATGNVYAVSGSWSAYSWGVSGSGSIAGSTTGSSVTVTAGASGSYTVSVTVTDGNGCTSTCSQPVTINGLPSATIIGPPPSPGPSNDTLCGGHTYVFTGPPGMSAYQWNVPSNGTITGSATGSSVMITVNSNVVYGSTMTVYLTVTDANGCTNTGTIYKTLQPSPTCSLSGPLTVCGGSTGNVYTVTSNAQYYVWSISGNGTITSPTVGYGINSVTVTAGASGTYTVTVDTKFSFQTCMTSCSQTVTVNSTPAPEITGPTSVCTGGNATLDAGAGYATYAWSNGGGSGQTATYNSLNASGTYTVTVSANGCTGTDTHTVTVQSCLVEFSGKIIWEHDDVSGVNNTTVKLTGSATGTDVSDINGDYLITTALTTGSFTLKPTKNLNKTNGLSAADATAVQQHVNLSVPITDPYKMVCADVNKSNSITTLDASLITQVLLGNPQANAIFNTSWRFTPTTPALNNPPWGFAEQRTYTNVSGPQANQDFFGMKLGDVTADYANPANFGAGEPLVFRVKDRVLQSGETVAIDFSADQLDDLAAFQFALTFDPAQLQFEAVEPTGSLPVTADHFGTYSAASGEIRAVWAQATGIRVEEATPAFRLRFKALQTGVQLSNALQMDDAVLPARTYTSKLAESKVELRFSESTGTNDPATVSALQLQVRPNPFREETTVSFSLPAAGEAQLRVLDVNGRELLRINNTYPAGINSETLRLDGITASGVLTCELVTPFGVATRKMVLAR